MHLRRTGAARALTRRLSELRDRFENAYHLLARRAASVPAPSYASEWFLDNYHLVRAEVEEVANDLPRSFHRQLPRLARPRDEALAGLPRVHALAIALVDASECRPEIDELATAVARYQQVAVLTIGELWAVPAMLRLVLLDRLAEAIATELDGTGPVDVQGPDQTVERCITSLRRIDAEDWMEFFERLSHVEAKLRADPSGVYGRMAFETRDRYRKEIERIARRCPASEVDVAELAVALAGAQEAPPLDHVGYFLVDAGLGTLEQAARCRPSLFVTAGRLVRARPTALYLTSIFAAAAACLGLLGQLAAELGVPAVALLALLLIGIVPALTIAVASVNIAVTQFIRPSMLPRMDLDDGVPSDARTLVVMPVLLADVAEVHELLERLERHYLTEPDPRIGYALLSDFADAPAPRMPRDREVLDAARDGIGALNRRHGVSNTAGPFHLLHRERRWSASERCWMGWERKRGKLEELNRLLAGDAQTSYTERVGATDFLSDIRYVITLDADTRIAREGARELIAIACHPLNRPRHDRTGRVIAGHGILQPRMEILPEMANRSRFARLFSGDTGLDPYTLAVSDTYQDLFGEGIYVGKGLFDVAAFRKSLEGRIPPSTLLSHDLIEGLYARPALVSDVVFFEDYPTHQLAQLLRAQRWIRGDWQLLPWLVRPAAMGLDELPAMKSVIGRWKILDNLRRSLLAPSLLALLMLGWLELPAPLLWTGLALATLAMPVLMGMAIGLLRTPFSKSRTIGREIVGAVTRFTLAVAFLPVEAAMALHSIGLTLWRVYVSRRRLLQWTTAADVARRSHRASLVGAPAYRIAAGITLALALATFALGGARLQAAAPILLLWLFAPVLSRFLGNPVAPRAVSLTDEDRRRLRLLARRTWLYFETFVGPDDRWLPPDNVQETDAGPSVAHRTSPTNIGMLLTSTVAAYEFGYIGVLELAVRIRQTLDSIAELDRYRGHLFNWYDSRTLSPLAPRYISTVDSGNLAACLVVAAQTCTEAVEKGAPSGAAWRGFVDVLDLLGLALQALPEEGATARARAVLVGLRASAAAAGEGRDWAGALDAVEPGWRDLQRALLDMVRTPGEALGDEELDEVRTWFERARHHLHAIRREIRHLAPWIDAVRGEPQAVEPGAGEDPGAAWAEFTAGLAGVVPLRDVPGTVWRVRERLTALRRRVRPTGAVDEHPLVAWSAGLEAALREAERAARDAISSLEEQAERAHAMILEMDFEPLYDRRRRLFHIGYQVDAEAPDPSHYDLLASEARVASLLAVAKHEAPVEHWRQLGRPYAVRGGRRVLLSWSGTMFEYLMPRLFLRSYHGTLLDQSCASAVEIQRRYGAAGGRPWGVSESAYNRKDSAGVYQYKAFGVPELGLKRGLGEDAVVAPYASFLALPYAPRGALENFDALIQEGALGRYGFYDAIDYTPTRLPLGAPFAVVRTFMAHHQGMTLASLCNFLCGEAIVERFHSDARVRTVEPLLQERLPTRAIQDRSTTPDPIAPAPRPQRAAVAWQGDPYGEAPAAHLLSNGHYAVLVTATGAGQSTWKGTALTRWRADATLEPYGFWIYVQDDAARPAWSIGRAPTPANGGACRALFFPHKAEFRREVADTIATMEVVTAPVDDIEIRRVTLTNTSDEPRNLRVTGYAEVALSDQAADLRHPAFQKLFVEAGSLPGGGGLVFRRRPRQAGEPTPSIAHRVVFEDAAPRSVRACADRELFLGRGRTAADPRETGGSSPGVPADPEASLDPVMSLGADVSVPGHSSVRLAFVTAAGQTPDAAIRALGAHSTWARLETAIDGARVQSEQEMRRHDLTSETLADYQRLLSAALFRDRGVETPTGRASAPGLDRTGLWKHGISGDRPLVLVRVDDPDQLALVQSVLGAHAYWRRRSFRVDLAILDEHGSGYDLEIQNKLDRLLIRRGDDVHLGPDGGIFVLRASAMEPVDLRHLVARAGVVLEGRAGPLGAQLAGRADASPGVSPSFGSALPATPPLPSLPSGAASSRDTSGVGTDAPERDSATPPRTPWGGFSADAREYAIHVTHPDGLPPVPWCNVVANESFGFLTSEAGLGTTWSLNSGEHRLTPWTNDPVTDPPAEVVYVRDEETALVWSATPAPAGAGAAYRVRHGAGFTSYRHQRQDLEQELTAFVDPEASLKYLVLRIRNLGQRPRRLTVTYYVPWILGTTAEESRDWVVPEHEPGLGAILATSDFDASFSGRVAFAASPGRPLHGCTTDRREFLGRLGTHAFPAGLAAIGLSGAVRAGAEPCAALQVHVDLPADGEEEVVFVLGDGADRVGALRLLERARAPGAAAAARSRTEAAWDEILGSVRVRTPDPGFDALMNRWLPYQVLACRIWARSGFYQSSGAYGFRDQLQDVMALFHARPDIARGQILRSAAHQFAEGDVLHWWHPPAGKGVRTRISDDLLWLPWVTCRYVRATGDAGILDEVVPFLGGPSLEPGIESLYADWDQSSDSATLFEHCRRAIERGATVGAHGLPLIGAGDWNDGMNRVGVEGRGESVWLGWFLLDVLAEFAALSRARGLERDAAEYDARAAELTGALEEAGWDGQWYRRAYYDDGTPLGSANAPECKIDAIAQSWSVLAKAAPPERAGLALDSLRRHLVRPDARLSLLLAPPFDDGDRDPGYIQGYRPGVRENGGQYTHAATWTAWAFAERGDADEAYRLFGHCSPVTHADTPERARTYRAEPYVTAGDIYGAEPWIGRAGWSWYTGSAAWLYRLGLERILGIERAGETLRIDPRIPSGWPGFEAEYRYGSSVYNISVKRAGAAQRTRSAIASSGPSASASAFAGVLRSVTLDGTEVPDGWIPLIDDGRAHAVEATLTQPEGPEPGTDPASGSGTPPPLRDG